MKLVFIAFTEAGMELEQRTAGFLASGGYEVRAFVKSKYIGLEDIRALVPGISKKVDVLPVEESLGAWAKREVPAADGIVFIGASGIAVRTMAPFVRSKKTDPAVVVMDERGQFVISLLSGHLGGANELTRLIAQGTRAVPVITTATDVNRRLAVDVFSGKNGLIISDMGLAKEVSALILREVRLKAGAGVGFQGEFSQEKIPEFCWSGAGETSPDGKQATFWIELPDCRVLHLIPRNITLGIGCRKGTSKEAIREQVDRVLREQGIFPQAVARVASIDLKKEEPGLQEFCDDRNLSFLTFSGSQLEAAEGNFSASPFVSRVTGVDNVCERSACLGSTGRRENRGTLLVKKQAGNGVTVACAVEEWSVDFE